MAFPLTIAFVLFIVLKSFAMKLFIQKTCLFTLLFFTAVSSFAQEKKLDIDINVNKHDNWYQQPWMWVIGGALFILLLVALLRGKK